MAIVNFTYSLLTLVYWLYSYLTIFSKIPFKPEENILEDFYSTASLENKNRIEKIR
ncbi:MAG: hypothetical protein LBC44_02285 [Mycoplasmataceae bacterium]|nr:hypothetical protein [Mycoplasmataceae bacterium]